MMVVTLGNGAKMPIIGLGTWKMDDAEAERACLSAFEIGYRHIDTAKLYGNEAGVGRAVRASGIPREDIFITTKLWPTEFIHPQKGFDDSLARLGLDYVDLYLVHWPVPLMPKSVWRGMERIHASGRARAIGVSNYSVDDLERTLQYATISPMVNQVECNPWVYDPDLLEFCSEKHIVFEAYSPLSRASRLTDVTLETLAKKYGKTPAQILLRWNIEHGMVTIPKSSHPERMRENYAIFDFALEAADVATLDSLRG